MHCCVRTPPSISLFRSRASKNRLVHRLAFAKDRSSMKLSLSINLTGTKDKHCTKIRLCVFQLVYTLTKAIRYATCEVSTVSPCGSRVRNSGRLMSELGCMYLLHKILTSKTCRRSQFIYMTSVHRGNVDCVGMCCFCRGSMWLITDDFGPNPVL